MEASVSGAFPAVLERSAGPNHPRDNAFTHVWGAMRVSAEVRQTTGAVLRQLHLYNEARRLRNQYRRFSQRVLLRRLFRMYADGTFGRNVSYPKWRERLRDDEKRDASVEQMRDLRFLIEMCIRHGLAPAHGIASHSDVTTQAIASAVERREPPTNEAYTRSLRALSAATGAKPNHEAVRASVELLERLPRLDANGWYSLAHSHTLPTDTVVTLALDRLIDERRVPHAYEYDYIDDIENIVRSRAATGDGAHARTADTTLHILGALVGVQSGTAMSLPTLVRAATPEPQRYAPRRGRISEYARSVIPDLIDEFIALKAREDPSRFLEINREYSRRQRDIDGSLGPAGLSLLFGYERETFIMLRTLIELVDTKKLRANDEVLVIGPRHVDELTFFRNELNLRPTGLDLFDAAEDGIVAGDMHAMQFESERFKLIYCCSTLSYSFALRNVISEIARVCARPGYVILSDAGDRVMGVDPLGRSDPMNTRAILSCFHSHNYDVLFADEGVPLVADFYHQWPNVGLVLH